MLNQQLPIFPVFIVPSLSLVLDSTIQSDSVFKIVGVCQGNNLDHPLITLKVDSRLAS